MPTTRYQLFLICFSWTERPLAALRYRLFCAIYGKSYFGVSALLVLRKLCDDWLDMLACASMKLALGRLESIVESRQKIATEIWDFIADVEDAIVDHDA